MIFFGVGGGFVNFISMSLMLQKNNLVCHVVVSLHCQNLNQFCQMDEVSKYLLKSALLVIYHITSKQELILRI